LDYIEENLTESHSTAELSKIAALSPFYFQRLFTRLVKRPVNEYKKAEKHCAHFIPSRGIFYH